MIWFPLAIGAALFWSVGGVLVKKGYATVSPLWNNIINNFLTLFIWIPTALLLSRFAIVKPPWGILAVILSAALIYQLYYYSLSKGQLSLTGTIIAAYPMFTILLSHLFLRERLNPWQYGGVALILGGGVAVAFPEKAQVRAARDLSWMLWGLLGAASIGTGDFLSKFSVDRIGPYSHIFFLAIFNNLTSALNYLVDRRSRTAPQVLSRRFLPTFFGIALHLFGAICMMVSFGYGPVSLVSAVSSIYPALVLLLAIRFLNEKVNLKQGIGVGSIVAGLILIGIAASGIEA